MHVQCTTFATHIQSSQHSELRTESQLVTLESGRTTTPFVTPTLAVLPTVLAVTEGNMSSNGGAPDAPRSTAPVATEGRKQQRRHRARHGDAKQGENPTKPSFGARKSGRKQDAMTWQEWSDMQDAFEAKMAISRPKKTEAQIIAAGDFHVPYTSPEAQAAFRAFARKYVVIKATDAIEQMHEANRCKFSTFP